MGVIYVITNTVNGKQYVGQTNSTETRRWSQHQSDARTFGRECILHSAIRKYGPQAFTVKVVDSAITKDELDAKEREWIARLGTTDSELGYNCTTGGSGYLHSPSSRVRKKASDEKRARMRKGIAASWTPERRAAASILQRKLGAIRVANKTGPNPNQVAAMKRVWKERRLAGCDAVRQKITASVRATYRTPEKRQQLRDKWTPAMRARVSTEMQTYYRSFAGMVTRARRGREIREANGTPQPVVRLLEVA